MAAIWRLRQALAHSGKTRSPWYQDIARGLMTRPVKISSRAVGWPCDEVFALTRARIAGMSEEGIKALVDKLHAQRTEAVQ